LRLRGTSVKELESAGEDTSGVIESKSKLRSKVKSLSGVDILTDTGAYKSTYEILLEISKVWSDISDTDQAALLEILAGKNRANTAAAILSNTKDIEEAYASALKAEGSALKENEKYLDSIQGRLDQFANAVQTMWSNTISSELIKNVVQFGTGIVNIVEDIGLIQTALLATFAIIMKTQKLSIKEFLVDIWKWIVNLNDSLSRLPDKLQNVKSVLSGIKESVSATIKSMAEYAKALRSIDSESLNSVLGKAGLSGPTKELSAQQKQTAMSVLGEAAANKELTSQQAVALAQKYKLIKAEDGLNVAYASNVMRVAGVNRETRKSIISTLGLSTSTKKLTKDEIINAAAKAGITDAAEQETIANILLAKSNMTLKESMGGLLKTMAPMLAIAGVVMVVTLLRKAIDWATETMEEAQEAFDEMSDELSEIKQDLQALESQLETINDQIDELQNKGTLSFTEEEELSRLKDESAELERQISLKDQLYSQQQKKVNREAVDIADKYKNVGVNSGKTTGERAAAWSKVFVVAGAVASGLAALLSGGLSLLATAAIAAGGAVGGGLLGYGIGAGVGALEAKVGDSLDNMRERYAELEKEYSEAQTKYRETGKDKHKEKYDEASEALSEYEAEMAQYLSEMDAYYSSIDLSVYDPVKDAEEIARLRQEMNDFYDTQDKWAIQTGGADAKYNAITRIFGQNADETLKDIKADIEGVIKSTESTGKDVDINLEDMFPGDEEFNKFKQRLYDMGIYVSDVERYFNDLAEAKDDALNTDDYIGVAKNISSITDKLESLKSVISEIRENGIVSSKTMDELNESFGSIDAISDEWNRFVEVMMLGSASTAEMKAAVEDLVGAWLDNQVLNGPMTEYEKVAISLQLAALGVKNAFEVVNDAQKEAGLNAVSDAIQDKLQKKDAIEAVDAKDRTKEQKEQLKQLTEELKNVDVDADWIASIAEQYGLTNDELRDHIDLLKRKAELEKQQAEIDAYNTAKENKETLEKQLEEEKDKYTVKTDRKGNTRRTRRTETTYFDSEGNKVSKEEYEAHKAKIDELQDKIDKEEKIIVDLKPSANENEISEELEGINKQIESGITDSVEIKLDFEDFDADIDSIQNAYSTLTDAVKEYNKNGYLTLDNLQSLLSLSPEYLACLQMENGQLSINRQALEAMIQAKLADAKATVVQKAITQLNELATRKETDAINNSSVAASNAVGGLGTYAAALSNVSKDAITAAGSVAAFNAAVAGAQANELVDQAEIDAILSSMDSQLQMIDDVSLNLNTNFKSIVSPNGGGSGSDKTDEANEALDSLTKKYERKVNNLENQQEYLQNKIDTLEAQKEYDPQNAKGISTDYYEEQIRLENEKLKLYRAEYAELSKLEKTDEVAERMWELEHAIQESAQRTLEFRQSIAELYNTAFEDIQTAGDNKDDYLQDQKDYIEAYIEAQGRDTTKADLEQLRTITEQQRKDREETLEDLKATLKQGVDSGAIKEGSEIWIQMNDEIRATELAIQNDTKAINEYSEAIKNIPLETFDKMRQAFGFRDQVYNNQIDYIEGWMELAEKQGHDVPTAAYDKIIDIYGQLSNNTQADIYNAMEDLAKIEEDYGAGSEEYQEKYLELVELYQKKLGYDNATADAELSKKQKPITDFEDTKNWYAFKDSLIDSDKSSVERSISKLEENKDYSGLADEYQKLYDLKQADIDLNNEELAKTQAAIQQALDNGLTFEDEGLQNLWLHYKNIQGEIEESTTKQDEYNQSIREIPIREFESTKDWFAFEDSLLENRKKSIENYISTLEESGNYDGLETEYNNLIDLEQQDIDKNREELIKTQAAIEQALANGFTIADENVQNMYLHYHDVKGEIEDSTRRQAELNDEINAIPVKKLEELQNGYSFINDILGSYRDVTKGWIDLFKDVGSAIPDELYNELFEINSLMQGNNTNNLEDSLAAFEDIKANYAPDSEEYQNAVKSIASLYMEQVNLTAEAHSYNQEMSDANAEADNIPVENFERMRDAFAFIADVLSSTQGYIEGYISLFEELGADVPTELYDKLIDLEKQKKANSESDLASALTGFEAIKAAGFTAADEEYRNAEQAILDLKQSILDSDIAMAQWGKTIRDLEFEKFERGVSRANDAIDEIQKIYDLTSDGDVAAEDGAWTEDGMTSLGLMAQKMELAKQIAAKYSDEIKKLDEAYANSEMSEKEYYERLQQLKDGQWGAIDSYEAARDAIVDMEEARIDMIEEGINKEIEAYQELIETKKEELDAERDLHDFRNKVKDQTKDISALERQIAALSGSDNAADIAERRRLEAELREANDALNETYYDHSKDQQGKAFDDELESFQDIKENYVETLRESLDDTTAIISAKINELLVNADTVQQGVNNTAAEYGITLTDLLTNPWNSGSSSADDFAAKVGLDLASLLGDEGAITLFQNQATSAMQGAFGAAKQSSTDFTGSVGFDVSALMSEPDGPLYLLRKFLEENVTGAFGAADSASDTAAADIIEDAAGATDSITTGADEAGGAVGTFEEKMDSAIASFGEESDASDSAKNDIVEDTGEAGGAVGTFEETVNQAIDDVSNKIDGEKDPTKEALKYPWENPEFISLFGEDVSNMLTEALRDAQSWASDMKNGLGSAFDIPQSTLNTFSTKVGEILDRLQSKAEELAKELQNAANTETPDHTGNGSGGGGGGGGESYQDTINSSSANTKNIYNAAVYDLQRVLNSVFGASLYPDGLWGSKTESALKAAQETMGMSATGNYNKTVYYKMREYIDDLIGYAIRDEQNTTALKEAKNRVPWPNAQFSSYAKGTLGTKKDGWAFTDESWIGEEITLAAGKNGQIQYLKKGSSVMPSDISTNLIEWGKLNPEMMNLNGGVNVNMINNATTKPEFNLSFEALVKADKITEDTLPEVKKYVSQEINNLVKQMNYAIKGYSR
jgi:hypothetical protein